MSVYMKQLDNYDLLGTCQSVIFAEMTSLSDLYLHLCFMLMVFSVNIYNYSNDKVKQSQINHFNAMLVVFF